VEHPGGGIRGPVHFRSWPDAAGGEGSRKAAVRRPAGSPEAAFGENPGSRLPAKSRQSQGACRPAATCALQTSEKAGDLIAKRPERDFSLSGATAQFSV